MKQVPLVFSWCFDARRRITKRY